MAEGEESQCIEPRPEIRQPHMIAVDVFHRWRPDSMGQSGSFIADLRKMGFLTPKKLLSNEYKAAQNIAINHDENMKQIGGKEIVIFEDDTSPSLLVRYRESIKGYTESPATLEICLSEQGTVSPVYHISVFETVVNGLPTVVISALQRYKDEKLSTAEKPYIYPDIHGVTHRVPPLKEVDPRRYEEYQKESYKLEKLERKLEAPMPVIGSLVALAYARSKGAKQFILIPYQNQVWVKKHEQLKDNVVVPNVYDPTAHTLGMEPLPENNGLWSLRVGPNEAMVTMPEEYYNSLPLSAKGIAQRSLDGFTKIQPPPIKSTDRFSYNVVK